MTTAIVRLLAIVAILAALVAAILLIVPFPVHAQVASLPLSWTASGDDANVGTATTYLMRSWTSKPDTTAAGQATSWATGAVCTGLPVPLVAGSPQSANVAIPGGFITGRTYYFVLRVQDESGNLSPFSNVAWRALPDTIPPSPVLDLRAN